MSELTLPQGLSANFQIDDDGRCRIVVGYCNCNDRHFFPVRAFCPRCLEPMSARPVSGRGHVYAFATVPRRAPFDLPQPYSIGYVDLDEVSLRVFGLFSPDALPDLKAGAEVELKAMPIGTDGAGKPCLRPVYCPTGDSHG